MSEENIDETPKIKKTWKPMEEPILTPPAETVDSIKQKIRDYAITAPIFDANASAKTLTEFTAKYDGFIAGLKRLSQ